MRTTQATKPSVYMLIIEKSQNAFNLTMSLFCQSNNCLNTFSIESEETNSVKITKIEVI